MKTPFFWGGGGAYSCELYASRQLTFIIKVGRKAKIRNLYNQVPHLTGKCKWESDKNTRINNKQERQEVRPFLSGDHKAAKNRQDSITKTNMKHK